MSSLIKTRITKRRRAAMETTTLDPYLNSIILSILSRMPVKSVVRFKGVSKSWLTLIESPHFVAAHLRHSARNPYFLIRYHFHPSRFDASLALLRNDGAIHDLDIPFFEGLTCFPQVAGSCNGLICLDVSRSSGSDFVLWNVATNDFKRLPKPAQFKTVWMFSLGFGFNEEANDYVLVRIVNLECDHDPEMRVEVYKTSSGSWREILTNTGLPSCLICAGQEAVSVNGELHWMANGYGQLCNRKFIVSFDMKQETCRWTNMPANSLGNHVKAVKYNDSLALTVYPGFRRTSNRFELWVMNVEQGKRWSKEISTEMSRMAYPIGSWEDSDIIIRKEHELLLFNPRNRQTINVPAGNISGHGYSCKVFKYVDSLVSVHGDNIESQTKVEIEGAEENH